MTIETEKELDAKEKQVGKTQGIRWSAGDKYTLLTALPGG